MWSKEREIGVRPSVVTARTSIDSENEAGWALKEKILTDPQEIVTVKSIGP